ncbi:hypothetical protein RintRC_5611 [Richelia intracellularis]|nr:hypothetical protein RintRC_5611 [Richelia intracellularis]
MVIANIMHEDETGCVRHDPQKLARVLLRWYGSTSKKNIMIKAHQAVSRA